MVVSWNKGTPKTPILVGFSLINHPFLGYPHLWNPPCIYVYIFNIAISQHKLTVLGGQPPSRPVPLISRGFNGLTRLSCWGNPNKFVWDRWFDCAWTSSAHRKWLAMVVWGFGPILRNSCNWHPNVFNFICCFFGMAWAPMVLFQWWTRHASNILSFNGVDQTPKSMVIVLRKPNTFERYDYTNLKL